MRKDSNATGTSCTARLVPLKARRWRDRIREKSFLWSSVREPASRIVSTFYQLSVSVEGLEPSLTNLLKYVRDNDLYEYAYYFKILTLRRSLNAFRTDLYEEYVKEILYGFDFIGIAERPDESLAVLQLLLGLETEDMLYLSHETDTNHSTYQRLTDRKHKNRECIRMHAPKATLEMKEWFHTGEAEDVLEPDVMVYRAVNKSLDLTIEQLGRDKVEKKIKMLKWAQQMAVSQCGQAVRYPCTDDGQLSVEHDCLAGDVACGFQCLDELGPEISTIPVFQQLLAS
jgi:hypothetical protein